MGFEGKVNTQEKCPVCGGPFEKISDHEGFLCKKDFTRPTRYYLSAKGIGIPKKYSTRHGEVYDSWTIVMEEWMQINTTYKESRKPNAKPWDPNDWIAAKVVQQEFRNKATVFLYSYKALCERHKITSSRLGTVTNHVNNFLVPYFEGKDIREITKEQVKEFYNHLFDLRYSKNRNGEKKESYSDEYIRNILSTLHKILSEYRRDIPEFPEHAVLPKQEKQWMGFERQMAIEPHLPEKYSLPIRVLITTGMRTNELRALRAEDMIDGALRVWKAISDGKLRLSRKSGGEVIYQLPPHIWEELVDHVKGKGLVASDFIFTIDSRPLSVNRLPKVWRKACEKACVKYIPLRQAARHSTASRIMKEAKEQALERIQKQLGNTKQVAKKHYILE